jgi:hypothetical protein
LSGVAFSNGAQWTFLCSARQTPIQEIKIERSASDFARRPNVGGKKEHSRTASNCTSHKKNLRAVFL